MSKNIVYCAVSLDGYIAGPKDDLSWLETSALEQSSTAGFINFNAFLEQIGAILMGRRTFDLVMGFDGEWPYGKIPILLATTRPLPVVPPTVLSCSGEIQSLCAQARQVAGKKNIYIDGGALITQALDANCVDELILTFAPCLLGQGIPLYQGKHLHRFSTEYLGRMGEMMQVKLLASKRDSRTPS